VALNQLLLLPVESKPAPHNGNAHAGITSVSYLCSAALFY